MARVGLKGVLGDDASKVDIGLVRRLFGRHWSAVVRVDGHLSLTVGTLGSWESVLSN